jgi:N-methylhydantoinase B/oxoprolinase/acetone carboxylase alpha subunit
MTSKSAASVKKGDHVEFSYAGHKGGGEVTAVHKSDVQRTIKGKKIKREASKEEPAVEIKTDKGGRNLKSASEIKVK